MANRQLFVQLTLLFAVVPTQSINEKWYSRTFSGTATYYEETSEGHCALRNPLPSIYDGLQPVAINSPQYNGSTSCGMCIQVTGFGEGIGSAPINGTFTAFVSDQCAVCSQGDIDLAKLGNGRWSVEWVPVPCADGQVSFAFEESNSYFIRVQPRGLKSPATELRVNGLSAKRTPHNFFEVSNGFGFKFPVLVTVETVLGCTLSATVYDVTSAVYPSELLNTDCGESTASKVPSSSVAPVAYPAPEEKAATKEEPCPPLWGQCGGINYEGPSCCQDGGCTYSSEWYSQCRPLGSLPPTANRSCPPIYGQCGGIGFNGPNCCQEGSCIYLSEWYWQCLN